MRDEEVGFRCRDDDDDIWAQQARAARRRGGTQRLAFALVRFGFPVRISRGLNPGRGVLMSNINMRKQKKGVLFGLTMKVNQ